MQYPQFKRVLHFLACLWDGGGGISAYDNPGE